MHHLFGHHEKTEEEKQAALAEFHKRLADQPGDPPALDQLRNSGEVGVGTSWDDETLGRWLRAETYNVPSAEARLRKHAAWRAQYVPKGRIMEDEVKNEIATGKASVCGNDRQGRPLIVVHAKNHSRSARDFEESKRYMCYTLDACLHTCDLSRNPQARMICIMDLKGIGMDVIDQKVLHTVFDLLGNHYPERLGYLWMYEAPGIFHALWRIVSPFVDHHTRAKIKFVYGAEGIKEFQEHIPQDVLPKSLGGEGSAGIPVEQVTEQYEHEHPHHANGTA